MSVFIIDISGKVNNYDCSLCNSLCKLVDITLVAQLEGLDYLEKKLKLIHLVPKKYKSSENIGKRIVKSIECLINYLFVFVLIFKKNPSILHFQWFPFIEFCSIENYYVALIKTLRPKQKIVLTVHNVFPHEMSPSRREKYKKRFLNMDQYIDHYIVHVDSSKQEILNEFGVAQQRITVIPHGIFTPDYKPRYKSTYDGRHIIVYGYNSPYKGTDVLLDALQLMPSEEKKTISLTIAGKMSDDYYSQLQTKMKGLNVEIIPTYIPDQQLYEMIDKADYIALPYRKISQSGVLLLALYFRKPLFVSNLPSFVETLKGFTEDMFFESENAESLKDLIERHFNKVVDVEKQLEAISQLITLYSWDESARKTSMVYERISNNMV